jgi:hypothetical protein
LDVRSVKKFVPCLAGRTYTRGAPGPFFTDAHAPRTKMNAQEINSVIGICKALNTWCLVFVPCSCHDCESSAHGADETEWRPSTMVFQGI